MTSGAAVRERAQRVGAVIDEWLEELATGPGSRLVRASVHKFTRENEWHFDERFVFSDEYGQHVDEFCEMAVARDLCAPDWFADPARLFVRDGCPQCDGRGLFREESDQLCVCYSDQPWLIESVLRMLALPASMIIAQESIARGRLNGSCGVLYVTRYDDASSSGFIPDGDRRYPSGPWVLRPLPPLIGVRWPRLVRL